MAEEDAVVDAVGTADLCAGAAMIAGTVWLKGTVQVASAVRTREAVLLAAVLTSVPEEELVCIELSGLLTIRPTLLLCISDAWTCRKFEENSG